MTQIPAALVEPPAPSASNPAEPSGSSPDVPFAEAFAALLAGAPVPANASVAAGPVVAGAEP